MAELLAGDPELDKLSDDVICPVCLDLLHEPFQVNIWFQVRDAPETNFAGYPANLKAGYLASLFFSEKYILNTFVLVLYSTVVNTSTFTFSQCSG